MAVNLESPKASSHFSEEHNRCHSKSDSKHPSSPHPFSNFKKIDSELVLQLTFDTVDEAEHFYNAYGKELGFDVRRHSLKKKDGIVRNRVWVCSREGFRHELDKDHCRIREPRHQSRCGCKAIFRVSLDRLTGKYKVTTFESRHNHDLATMDDAKILRCNRQLSAADKSWLSTLTMAWIRPSQVMDLMEKMCGGPGKLNFQRKDGYNYLNGQRLKMIESGDVNTGLSILQGMKVHDKDLVFEYEVDDDGALNKLFWCDGLSRVEYELFGDVVAFDSTYKTNKYLFPLVIFSGVNNHFNTCVFGAALMYNETIASYRWLLRTFRNTMKGKIPSAVLTDQDQAIASAIRFEFPGARHRLCAWHIARNARTNKGLPPKFISEFAKFLSAHITIEEFEESWSNIVEAYDVSENTWIKDIYANRRSWCEAYFRGHFTAKMRTTHRSESMNALVKLCVKQSLTFTAFLLQFNETLKSLRSSFDTRQIEAKIKPLPIRPGPLKKLEEHAAIMCTKRIFYFIREEICKEQGLILQNKKVQGDNEFVLTFSEYEYPNRPQCSVTIDIVNYKFKCTCLMLESDGIPCRHIISGLKSAGFTTFPDVCILPRWLVNTGTILQDYAKSIFYSVDSERERLAEMNKQCMNLSFLSSKTKSGYPKSLNGVRKLSKMVEHEIASKLQDGEDSDLAKENESDLPVKEYNVRDPKKLMARGAPRAKPQHCGLCGEAGHKATTCKLNPAIDERRGNNRKKKKIMTDTDCSTEVNDANTSNCPNTNQSTPAASASASASTTQFFNNLNSRSSDVDIPHTS